MYANEFATKEKQKLTEIKKLTTTYTNRLDDEWAGCDPGGGVLLYISLIGMCRLKG